MRSRFSVSALSIHASLAVAVLAASAGCATSGVAEDVDHDDRPARVAQSAAACVVEAPEGVVAIAASAHGLALAVEGAGPFGDELVVHRLAGVGCDLGSHEPAYSAAGLFDLDDAGNLYLLPDDAQGPGAVSTVLPDSHRGGELARLDRTGRVEEVLTAGRGIWAFGVAPAGDALWVTACGPTGIFSVTGDGALPSLTPPDTQWHLVPSVLTDAETLWSVGWSRCAHGEPVSAECGHALTRTGPAGSTEVAPTLVDFGDGIEAATLARCGSRVCGVFESAVLVWSDDGAVEQTILPADALAAEDERITGASGSSHGVYVLLAGGAGTRVVFVPRG